MRAVKRYFRGVAALFLVSLVILGSAWAAGPVIISEEPLSGQVRVVSNVGGVTFTLVGQEFTTKAGKALILGDVPAGIHEVRATKEGFQEWKSSLKVVAGKRAQLTITMVKQGEVAAVGTGRVRVTSNVDEATVRLAGLEFKTKIGSATTVGQVPVGRHLVKVSKTGYKNWQAEIEVLPEQQVEVAIEMSKKLVKAPAPKNKFINNIGIQFIRIRPGGFVMGSPPGHGFTDERPAHRVKLTKEFWISKYEVTQLQYSKVMGENPSKYREDQSDFNEVMERPVERVSWEDAMKFVERLNHLEGTHRYRLPTEAEWEYVCRAGGTHLDTLGQVAVQPQKVGVSTNPWDVWDMQGNVSEWTADWYGSDYYSVSPVKDPSGPAKGHTKIFRGGSFKSEEKTKGSTRSNHRASAPPHKRLDDVGIRLVYEK